MKFTKVVFAMVLMAMSLPTAASAALPCLDNYYKCLNDSWDTKGFERFLADAECGSAYIGCIRRSA